MDLLLFQEAVLLVATAIAALTDWKKGLIYDWITYPLIAVGVLFTILQANWMGLALAIGVFVIMYALYWLGKLGGGDVKLFTGITLAMPFYQEQFFLLPVLFFAGLGAIAFYSLYYIYRLWKSKQKLDWKENQNSLLKGALFAILFSLYFVLLNQVNGFSLWINIGLWVVFMLASIFVALEHEIKKRYFIVEMTIEELGEDEPIALEFTDPTVLSKTGLGTKGIVGEKEKEKLRELGIQRIPVYAHAPKLGPFIFIGVVLALYFPSLLQLFFLPI